MTPPHSTGRHGSSRLVLLVPFSAPLVLFGSSCARDTAGKSQNGRPGASAPKPKVKTVAVEQRQRRRAVEAVGSLFAYDEVTVSSEAEGRVEEVMVDVGDSVGKGQALARVSPVEFQLTVDQQQAALRQARARLGLTETDGDLKDVRQAAEVKKAAADLTDAEQKYKRAQSLLETGVIPRQQYDEAEARYKAAKATYDMAMQQVEKMSPWVRVGREVKLSLEAFPGREFTGRVSRINPSVDEKNRTFEIEALVSNRGGELKPGSFVKATIQSDKVDQILAIPYSAAAYLFGAYKVFVLQGQTIKEREVKLGGRLGDLVAIIEGLQAGEKIAVSAGGPQLKDGMEVEIVSETP